MSDNNVNPEGKAGITRRRFLIGTGGVAGGLALAGGSLAGLTVGQQAGVRLASAQTLKTDLDILQFALTLEHFENAAYKAANASGLLKGTAADLFKAFGDHEAAHVAAVTDTIKKLGGTPVAAQAKYNLPTLQNQEEVVRLFTTIEEVGAGAYLGAAPLIKDKGILGAAASILNVEAQHASTFKAFMNDPMPSPAFGMPLTPDQVLAAVKPFLEVSSTPPPAGGYFTIDNPAPSLAVAVNRINSVSASGVLFFPETGHSLSGAFQKFYKDHGGLTLFGFPISEPFSGPNRTDGKTYTQQFFQRARMEYHPENKGTPYEVLLGLLGSEQVFKDMMGNGQ